MANPTLLVIFGAGASYDFSWRRPVSDPAFTHRRVPLAKDLFHERFGAWVRYNPASMGLMRRLRAAATLPTPEIEPELERIRAESEDLPYLKRQLRAVQHYLRDVVEATQNDVEGTVLPDGVTNYVELIQEIERWRTLNSGRVCLVTFNYDTLLEHACESVLNEFRLHPLENFTTDQRYAVVKLHGSIEWTEIVPAPEKNFGGGPYDSPDVTWRLGRSGDYRYRSGSNVGEAAIPAVALPTVTKTSEDFVCPTAQTETMRKDIGTATHMLVIGWRGAEEHFHELWREARGDRSLTRWGIVDFTDEAGGVYGLNEARERIRAALRLSGHQMFWDKGFSEFTKDFGIRAFLA